MKLNEILEKNPLSVKKLKGWILEEMLKSSQSEIESIPGDFIEAVTASALSNQNILETLLTAPRIYFTFFDLNDLFINVTYSDGFFMSSIYGKENHDTHFTDRKDAELNSLSQAFYLLEGRLKSEE